MRSLILGTALAVAASASAANATVTISLSTNQTLDFAAFNNATSGATSGTSISDLGQLTWTTGSNSSALNHSIPSEALAPNATTYLYATTGSDVTVSWTTGVTGFDIYWGSPDWYNSLVLGNGDVISGSEVLALTQGLAGYNSSSAWVHVADTDPITSFTATSSAPAFEFDMSAPEASTWAMMGLGFAALGFAAFRRTARTPAAIA